MITWKELEDLKKTTKETGGRTDEDICESVAYSVYTYLTHNYAELSDKKGVVLCDTTEIGTYGMVLAYFIDENMWDIKVRVWGKESDLDDMMKDKLTRLRKDIVIDEKDLDKELKDADYIIDSFVNMDKELIEKINKLKTIKISIESPGGMDLSKENNEPPFVDSDRILTVHDKKKQLEQFKDKVATIEAGLGDFTV